VEYPSREIWLSEVEASWLPSDGSKLCTDGSLFEGRVDSAVFLEELDVKASFALGTFANVVKAEVYAILACSDYQGWYFSSGTLYRDLLIKIGSKCVWFLV
jgi:hypothetical protein